MLAVLAAVAAFLIAAALAILFSALAAVLLEGAADCADRFVRLAVLMAHPAWKERIEEQANERLSELLSRDAAASRVVWDMATMVVAGWRTRSTADRVSAVAAVAQRAAARHPGGVRLVSYSIVATIVGTTLVVASALTFAAVSGHPVAPVLRLAPWGLFLLPVTAAQEDMRSSTGMVIPKMLYFPVGGIAAGALLGEAGMAPSLWWIPLGCFYIGREGVRRIVRRPAVTDAVLRWNPSVR